MRFKIFFVALFLLTIIGCKKEREFSIDKKLLSVYAEYMYYPSDYLGYYGSMVFPAHEQFALSIDMTYDLDNIVKIRGGLRQAYHYGAYTFFSDEIYDSIVRNENTIHVFILPEQCYSIFDKPKNPLVFELNEDNSLSKITKREGVQYLFTREGNTLLETSTDGQLVRKYYFENENLKKVVQEKFDTDGTMFYRKEIIFEKYDNKPNPLKNKYFIMGAFYRAFSKNNYTKITINEYEPRNGEMVICSSFWQTTIILYDENGYPVLGEYE